MSSAASLLTWDTQELYLIDERFELFALSQYKEMQMNHYFYT